MLQIKFFKIYPKPLPITTGGHVYDNNLLETINKSENIRAENTYIGCDKKILKIFRPFVEFFKGLKNRDADVIVFNSSSCLHILPLVLFLKVFNKKSEIHTIHHHFIYLEFKGFKRWIYKTAENELLKNSNKIIVPSPYIYQELKKSFSEDKLLFFRIPFEAKQEFKPAPVVGNLSFTGTIEPRKGLIYLFQALKKLQEQGVDYHLNVIGKVVNEDYFRKLKDFAEINKLNVDFLGFIDRKDKNKILSETDIFVFPSLLEGFGMVLVEAQVYGLPIVTFDNSAMPFTVKNDENGFTVPTFNVDELSKKIEEIINNRELRNKLSQGALKNVKSQWIQETFEKAVNDYYSQFIPRR